jgi:hypothetical protein
MACMLCLTHVVDYSAFLFVNLVVLGFFAIPDTCSATEDLHCFTQFSKEKTQEKPFFSCHFQLAI